MNAVAGTAIAGGAADSELVEAVRAGDDCAFEELYRRHRPRVSRLARSMLRDEGRAEDATQDAFLSALRRLRETDAEIRFRPWICEIARNAAIDVHRRRSRSDEVSLDASAGLGPADTLRLSRPGDLDRAVVDRERMQALRGALDELSETHHRVIVLRELEGRSYREIGESTGLSHAAVESTLFRARRKLEHEYDQIDSGRRCTATTEAIERLAGGVDAERDRRRLARHARRCSACRRYARARGIEPAMPSRLGRVAALLPLPGLLRRRLEGLAASDPSGLATLTPAADLGARAATAAAALAVAIGGGSVIGSAAPAPRAAADAPSKSGAVAAGERRPATSMATGSARATTAARAMRAARTRRQAANAPSRREGALSSSAPGAQAPAAPAPTSGGPQGSSAPKLPGLPPAGGGGLQGLDPPEAPKAPAAQSPQLPSAPSAPASAPALDGPAPAVPVRAPRVTLP